MKKILLIVVGTITALLLIELVLRTLPKTTLKFYDNDIFGSALSPSQSGWFVPASKEYKTWVTVNSHGWPDVEHSYEKPERVFRILIIGDSFVENLQAPLEKRFFRQLQQKLGNKVEIIAIGRGNTGTAQQYLILKNFGLKYQPDLVIQMFLTANDIKNSSPFLQNDPYLPYFEIDENGDLKEISHKKRSDRKLASLKGLLKSFRITEIFLSVRQRFLEEKANKANGYPIDYHIYNPIYDREYVSAWKITKKLLIETKEEVKKTHAQYILVSLANNEQVNQKVREDIFEKYPLAKEANLDFEKPDQILKDLCEKEKIECYFMLPFFKEHLSLNPQSQLYHYYEGHWNQTGTNLAAEFLREKLEDYFEIK